MKFYLVLSQKTFTKMSAEVALQVARCQYFAGYLMEMVSDPGIVGYVDTVYILDLYLYLTATLIPGLQAGTISVSQAQLTLIEYIEMYSALSNFYDPRNFVFDITLYTSLSGGSPTVEQHLLWTISAWKSASKRRRAADSACLLPRRVVVPNCEYGSA